MKPSSEELRFSPRWELWVHIRPFLTHSCMSKVAQLNKAWRQWIYQDSFETFFKADCFRRSCGFYCGFKPTEFKRRVHDSNPSPRTWFQANLVLDMEEAMAADTMPEFVHSDGMYFKRSSTPQKLYPPLWRIRHTLAMATFLSPWTHWNSPIYQPTGVTSYLECGFYERVTSAPKDFKSLVRLYPENDPTLNLADDFRLNVRRFMVPLANWVCLNNPELSKTPSEHWVARRVLDEICSAVSHSHDTLQSYVTNNADAVMKHVSEALVELRRFVSLDKYTKLILDTVPLWPQLMRLSYSQFWTLNTLDEAVECFETGAGLEKRAKRWVLSFMNELWKDMERVIEDFITPTHKVVGVLRGRVEENRSEPCNCKFYFTEEKAVLLYSVVSPGPLEMLFDETWQR
eukprot:Blabericola_migrator_1__13252@NODE_922_length_6035_cov_55_172587_g641_i0_p2_GENE_NODE_922_length_6035_cov_55_172587_g641_i0NODE_922_length_6035_cov_55_172587_g641_i0_p2_ORF_typecomplete_len401_score74_76_NODE_922_length_6035_cov_55_172587_g641_i013372539